MASSDGKFGTFGGVFTPSLLTILGVIMYMRLPWVVGHAGFAMGVGIVLVAHIVSVSTGLSISSIATDKSVGAGGPYYIVSRSLGLPIGGALGLALFLGLSFSISLYVIGFSESFLQTIGVAPSADAIRVCGTVTVVLITVITFISTSLAIQTQYVILALIALSLGAVFLGSPEKLASVELPASAEAAPSFGTLFGIFFPAVTGFTAGVNMSGDLRSPKKSIPRGTMGAIAAGLAVYLGLSVYLSLRVEARYLVGDPQVLEHLALWGPAVTAGIWGATLSSALGSILGAPRILQAVSADGITPRWLARGYGKTNEPRNALLVAFAIGEAGILIAELNVIARVVSIVFMTMYAFLNTACAIESAVSPDFRPDFRIPKTVSVVGAVTAVLLMISMDLVAMAAATVMMAGLYVYLQRRQLQLDSGDAWEGIWSALVRAGLHRLARAARQHRNWQPNILLFRPGDDEPRHALRRTAASLITGSGMLTDVVVRAPGQKASADDALEAGPVVGKFDRTLTAEDPYEAIATFCRYHGYSGIEPNTVLLDWEMRGGGAPRFARLVDELRAHDLNTLLFSDATHEPPAGTPLRVDVWWREDSTPALAISLIRFLTSAPEYRSARVRFLTVSSDASTNDALRTAARRMLEAARVSADVEVLLDAVDPRPFESWVTDKSKDAKLALVELPKAPLEPYVAALDELRSAVPRVLFLAGSSAFGAVGRVVRPGPIARAAPKDDEDEELEPLELPAAPELAREAEAFAARVEGALGELFEASIDRAASQNLTLLMRTQEMVDRHFGLLASGLESSNPVKQRRAVNRVQSAFLIESGKIIAAFVDEDLAEQRDVLEARIAALLEDESLAAGPEEIVASQPGGRAMRVHPAPLLRYWADKARGEAAARAVRRYAREGWSLAVQLGRIFNGSRTSLTLLAGDPSAGASEGTRQFVETQQARAKDEIAELAEAHERTLAALRARLRKDARAIAQGYASDLARPDVNHHARTQRRPARDAEARRERLRALPEVFYEQQRAIFERAQIGLDVSGFQHRIATIARRAEEAITLELTSGVARSCAQIVRELERFVEDPEAELPKPSVDLTHRFDPQRAIDPLAREGRRSTDQLRETARTLSDASIQRLAEGDPGSVEMVDLPLRRLAQFLLDAELLGPLAQTLAEVPALEERAASVADDVLRILEFHRGEGADDEVDLRAVVRSALERMRREVAPLEAMAPRVQSTLATRLDAVVRSTDVYELTSSAQALMQHIRRHQGQRALSGAQSLALRGAAEVRRALVTAVYGRSAGLLMARRLRERGPGALVDRVMSFVADSSPRPTVLEELPFYYRQLFLAKTTIDDAFWVERDAEMARARRGIARFDAGARGLVVVTGEPASGKTALCRRLASRALSGRTVCWIPPPADGAASVEDFRAALAQATEQRGDVSEIVSALPERSVIVLEDLELWWERGPGGLAVVDAILAAIEASAGRVLFVLDVGSHAFRMIDRMRGVADYAIAVVECGALPAEALKAVVTLRHASTGMSFELGGKPEDQISEWRLARLFSRHFTYSGGFVGAALGSWIAHVDRADERVIAVRAPARRATEVLDELRPEWAAVLVQLLLHKRMSTARLERVAGLGGRELSAPLEALARMGLVHRSTQDVLSVNRFVAHAVIDRLRARRVIP